MEVGEGGLGVAEGEGVEGSDGFVVWIVVEAEAEAVVPVGLGLGEVVLEGLGEAEVEDGDIAFWV